MEQVLPHAGEHRLGRLEIGALATDDKGEGARRGTSHPAGDGGIEEADTPRLRRRTHSAGRGHVYGGAVDHQGPRRQGPQQILTAPLRQPEPAHMTPGRQHADGQIAAGDCLPGIPGDDATGLDGPIQALGHQIKDLHCMARPGEVRGHGPSHVAEPDKSNPCHSLLLAQFVIRQLGRRAALGNARPGDLSPRASDRNRRASQRRAGAAASGGTCPCR